MPSNLERVFEQISISISRILSSKGQAVPPIDSRTILLDSELGIDSIDLALLVRELEEATGFDPFRDGFLEFRTVGELAKLYAQR
jgi:acyl carrier protein